MHSIIQNLERELALLQNRRDYVLKVLKLLPEGSLNIRNSNGKIQYKHRVKSDGKMLEKYIKKENLKLARQLAQKAYFRSLLGPLNSRIDAISRFIEEYKSSDLISLYTKLTPERKDLVSPIFPEKELVLKKWKDRPFRKKAFADGFIEIYTEKNERVRSKSEKILADFFSRNDLEYIYEKPLKLRDGRVLHPDFTFLDTDTLKEIYWEHFGMMDNPEYARSAANKLRIYGQNGIVIGKNLLVSFETSDNVIDLSQVKQMIDFFLK